MIYCFFGWIFESVYCSIKSRQLINRGFCRGPWIPIYGFGALSILLITEPFTSNLLLVWITGLIGATLLELITGYLMFKIFKVRWWDYSNDPFNLGGYICLGSSIAWGFLSVILTEVLHPFVLELISSWSRTFTIGITSVFYVLFTVDSMISFAAAWDIRSKILALSHLRAEMAELLADLDELTDDAKLLLLEQAESLRFSLHERADETLDMLHAKTQTARTRAEQAVSRLQERSSDLNELKEQISGRIQINDEFHERINALLKKRNLITGHLSWWSRNMLKNNPSANAALPGFRDMRLSLSRKTETFRIRIEDLLDEFLEDVKKNTDTK